MACFRVFISGRVQGVGYRYSTKEKAEALGIAGWVRNSPSGQVEAIIVGDSHQVDGMIAWFHEGPPAAKVTAVEAKEVEADEKGYQQFEGFEIRR